MAVTMLATPAVLVHASLCAAVRAFGLELQVRRLQWEWVLRTCRRLVVVGALELCAKRRSWSSLVLAIAGMAATYVDNVLGPAPTSVDVVPGGAILVTGATAGIGRATAASLVERGAVVVVPARDAHKAHALAEALNQRAKKNGYAFAVPEASLELSSQKSVARYAAALVKELRHRKLALTTLVLNAGVMLPAPQASVDGAELTIAANHLGHHALAMELLPELKKAASEGLDVRVIAVTSSLHHMAARDLLKDQKDTHTPRWAALADFSVCRDYSLFKAYSRSKLSQILWLQELHRQLKASDTTNIACIAVHPGIVRTQVGRCAVFATVRSSSLAGRPVLLR